MLTSFKPKVYDEKLKAFLGAKAEVKDYLHIAVINEESYKKPESDFYYAIFVWDTREVVEEGLVHIETKAGREFIKDYLRLPMNKALRGNAAQQANDSLKKLPGTSRCIQLINTYICKK